MKKKLFETTVLDAVQKSKRLIPVDTANMRENALKIDFNRAFKTKYARVYIDDEIATYVYYTVEPWISPRWHGRKNPNENWTDRFCIEIADNIARAFGGKVIEL